jgi:hypothetical protein
MRAGRLALAALLLCAAATRAQENAGAAPAETEQTGWKFNASLYGYFPPATATAQPTFIADRGSPGRPLTEGSRRLGLGRWNLEADLHRAALWRRVFGDTHGVAPGYELTLKYGSFELYSEGEYLFDTDDSENSFFYNWAQLGFSATDWLALGLASQRTRAYHTSLDVQRGVFAAFTYKKATLSVYVFNPGWETPTVVSSLAFAF